MEGIDFHGLLVIGVVVVCLLPLSQLTSIFFGGWRSCLQQREALYRHVLLSWWGNGWRDFLAILPVDRVSAPAGQILIFFAVESVRHQIEVIQPC